MIPVEHLKLCADVCIELEQSAPDFEPFASRSHLPLWNILKEVCGSHGVGHAYCVLLHTARGLATYNGAIPADERLAVCWAALLHDADDRKFFPHNANCENARQVMELSKVPKELAARAVELIGMVSASKNGDAVPAEAAEKPWVLYPRYADRLEGVGHVGISRCWAYTHTLRRPLWVDGTARAKTEPEVWEIATPQRFAEYKGDSASMIDHFYDKLLPMSQAETGSRYFNQELELRRRPLVEVCLELGRSGKLGEELLRQACASEAEELWRGAPLLS